MQRGSTPSTSPRTWASVPAIDNGEAIVAALTAAGVEYVFFTSGTEIGFYQEATSKAAAEGRPAPKLITVTHEHVALNAALGYAAVSGKPAVVAIHIDVGTQHLGAAVHSVKHNGLPVLITAGAPATAYTGSVRGARDAGHFWLQQAVDQNGIVRQYMKWDHRLQMQDNPAIIISRALQVACAEPCGGAYLSMPREVVLAERDGVTFPSLQQLGLPVPPAPDAAAIEELAGRLIAAENPFILTARSGRKPATVPALVRLAEFLGAAVAQSGQRTFHCFPQTHPLYQSKTSLAEADAVLLLDVDVPWVPGPDAPPDAAFVASVGIDAVMARIPTMEFTADLRIAADAMATIEALTAAVEARATPEDRRRFAARAARWAAVSAGRREALAAAARKTANAIPIDPRWLSYTIGEVLGDTCTVFDDTVADNVVHDYLRCDRPGSYFYNPSSSGGWAVGAALGAKLAAPQDDVVVITGDGFYMFGTPIHALWSAKHHGAPFMAVVYQNRSYSTGTLRVSEVYPEGHAQHGGFGGGYFDPPIDFAKEAEAAGAYGETVTDPAEVAPALRRGLAATRSGTPAVISVWLPRYLQPD